MCGIGGWGLDWSFGLMCGGGRIAGLGVWFRLVVWLFRLVVGWEALVLPEA